MWGKISGDNPNGYVGVFVEKRKWFWGTVLQGALHKAVDVGGRR